MPPPTFKGQLEGNLAPGVTILSSGNYFDTEVNLGGLNITTMNEDLGDGGEVVFIPPDPPKEDMSFQFYVDSQKKGEIDRK